MKLLLLDTETCSEDSGSAVCEISGTLYNISGNVRETGAIASVSTVLPVTQNGAEFINGIPPELTQISSIHLQSQDLFRAMLVEADYPVAFNAEFDSEVITRLFPDECLNKLWLCAMRDFNWGYHTINAYGGYSLVNLALSMGIGVATAHRAGDDVRLLTEVFNRRKPDLPQLLKDAIALASSPTIELKACVTYKTKDLASSAKFTWDGERKIWFKKIKECHLAEFLSSLNFEVVQLVPDELQI